MPRNSDARKDSSEVSRLWSQKPQIVASYHRLLQTLDLQRSSLHQGLYDKNSKFMPIKKV